MFIVIIVCVITHNSVGELMEWVQALDCLTVDTTTRSFTHALKLNGFKLVAADHYYTLFSMQVTFWKFVTAVSVSTISVGIKSAAFKGLRHRSDCSRRNTRLRITLAGFMDVSYPSKICTYYHLNIVGPNWSSLIPRLSHA